MKINSPPKKDGPFEGQLFFCKKHRSYHTLSSHNSTGIIFNTRVHGRQYVVRWLHSDTGIIFNTCVHGRQYVVRWLHSDTGIILIPVYMGGSTWFGGCTVTRVLF